MQKFEVIVQTPFTRVVTVNNPTDKPVYDTMKEVFSYDMGDNYLIVYEALKPDSRYFSGGTM